jgi:hypothetical protein
MLSLFAERVRPEPRPLPSDAVQTLDALLTRRRQLLDMLTAERNRLGQTFGPTSKTVKDSLKAHIAYLERELRMSDTELSRAIRESPVWREASRRTCCAACPAWGGSSPPRCSRSCQNSAASRASRSRSSPDSRRWPATPAP